MFGTTPPGVSHLYAHIPFCPAKCPYCAFVTHVGSLKLVQPYVDALLLEVDRLQALGRGGPLDTIYLGGGTPSMLTPGQVEQILSRVVQRFGATPDPEITLEAHPGTVDVEKLTAYRELGVTRLSFGGESLDDFELQGLGRTHTPGRVLEAVADARTAGFCSVNVDLMYGVPGQTPSSWERTLQRLIQSGPDHASLYPLSVEPRTVFHRRAGEGRLHLPADSSIVEMYHVACELLSRAGYIHYEVANWAQPGHMSRHNLAYWRGREWYAAGVGAHGYLRPYRTENMRGTRRYIDRLSAGESPVAQREYTDPDIELSETVMLRLRLLQEGLDLSEVQARFGMTARQAVEQEAVPAVRGGLMRQSGERLVLEERAVPLGNEVWERFVGLRVRERVKSAAS